MNSTVLFAVGGDSMIFNKINCGIIRLYDIIWIVRGYNRRIPVFVITSKYYFFNGQHFFEDKKSVSSSASSMSFWLVLTVAGNFCFNPCGMKFVSNVLIVVFITSLSAQFVLDIIKDAGVSSKRADRMFCTDSCCQDSGTNRPECVGSQGQVPPCYPHVRLIHSTLPDGTE